MTEKTWYLYILRCADGSLYTGITTDVRHRLQMHESGKGAKYTRGRALLELVYSEQCTDHCDALRREYFIKTLTKQEKIRLIEEARHVRTTQADSD